jgi:hypothetical protein
VINKMLDGYDHDPTFSARVAREVAKLENVGRVPRHESFIVTPDLPLWRKMGNRTFYRLYGLHYFGKRDDPAHAGLERAFQKAGSRVFIKDGNYSYGSTVNMFPSTTASQDYAGIHIEGESFALKPGGSSTTLPLNRVGVQLIWTGSSGGTMMQTSPQNNYNLNQAGYVSGRKIENLTFDPGPTATAAGIGLDMTTQETGLWNTVEHCAFGQYRIPHTGDHFFTTCALVMDGNEDSKVEDCHFPGFSSGHQNAIDIQWQCLIGNVTIINTTGAGAVGYAVQGEDVSIINCTTSGVKLLGNIVYGLWMSHCYMKNNTSAGAIVALNSYTAALIKLINSEVGLTASIPFISGSGTASVVSYSGNSFTAAASSAWTSGAPTISNSKTSGDNWAQNTVPTGAPYSADGIW